MNKPESVLDNETHEILWDFKIQMKHPILARRPDVELINKTKRTCHLIDFPVPSDHWVKINENETIDRYLDPARELKRTVEQEGDGDTNCIWYTWNGLQRLEKRLKEQEIRRRIESIPTTVLFRLFRILRGV